MEPPQERETEAPDYTFTEEERASFKQLLLGNQRSLVNNNLIDYFSIQIDTIISRATMKTPGCRSLFIDIGKINEWDPGIISKLTHNPEIIDEMTKIFEDVLSEKYGVDFLDLGYFHARPTLDPQPPGTSGFDSFCSDTIGKTITVRGVVTSMTAKKPYPVTILFRCNACRRDFKRKIDTYGAYHPPPKMCPNEECPSRGHSVSWDIVPSESRFIELQYVTVQEELEYLGSNRQSRSLTAVITDDIVDMLKPGSRSIITGVVLATPEFKEDKKQYDYPLFSLHLHAHSIKMFDTDANSEFKLDPRRIDEIMVVVEQYKNDRKAYFDFLIGAVAPMIKGHENEKLALLVLLFGGQTYAPPGGRSRGIIHVLLFGDPGTGKSQMIKAVEYICPGRFQYASGQGATKAGLTAAVVDGDNGPELMAGATVLADMGVAAVDEIDKMRPEDKSALHEMMESQIVTIFKWKFREALNARTAIIAAANPKYGRVLAGKTIQSQLDMIPLPILSRFDLIFLFRDIPNVGTDNAITDKINEARSKKYARPLASAGIEHAQIGQDIEINDEIKNKMKLVRDLIAHARNVADASPIDKSAEALAAMKALYNKIRADTVDAASGEVRSNLPIPITTRQYESIDRIATALAKARFSNIVDAEDVEMAKTLVMESMKQIMLNEVGEVDAGLGETGRSAVGINASDTMITALYSMQQKAGPDGVEIKEFKKKILAESKINEELFKQTVKKLEKEGKIAQTGPYIKLTSEGIMDFAGV